MKLSGFEPDDELADPILDPALPIIDAHHHLWPSGAHIPYDLADFGEDLASGHNIVGTVFVECMTGYRQDGEAALRPVGETEFAVGEAGGVHGVAAGIVGYADLTDPRVAARTLDGHIAAGQGRFSGVRHNVVWHEREELIGARRRPPGLLLEPAFRESLAEVARRGLTYDVWLFHGQLAELAATADALPELVIIANHMGGPVTHLATPGGRAEVFGPWREALIDLARRPNVRLKLGGMGMTNYAFGFEQRPTRPTSAELAAAWEPYIDVAVNAFGADRCMFESNFPVDKQSFSYRALWNAFKRLAAACSIDEKASLFSETARRVYKIDKISSPAGAL